MTGPAGSLSLEDWRARLRDFAAECEDGRAADEADRIREAWVLCRMAPPSRRALLAGHPDATMLQSLLAAGAVESAALALIGPAMGYMLSRGGNGTALASVIVPHAGIDHSAEGATPALALVAALALALAAQADDGGPAARRLN